MQRAIRITFTFLSRVFNFIINPEKDNFLRCGALVSVLFFVCLACTICYGAGQAVGIFPDTYATETAEAFTAATVQQGENFTATAIALTPTATPSPSDTPTNTPTFTPSHTSTITNTPTDTLTPSDTPLPSNTPPPTNTFTPSNTPLPTSTPFPVTPLVENRYINTETLNVRAGPGIDFEIIDTLTLGTQIAVTGHYNNWYRILRSDGSTGWIGAGFTTSTRPATPTATLTPLEAAIWLNVPGIQNIRLAHIRDNLASWEIDVRSGFNNQQTAEALYQVALQFNDDLEWFSVILSNEQGQATDWILDLETNTWRTTELNTSTNNPTRTPRPTITAPAPTTSICQQYAVPQNCATAAAYGLDASTIAQCWPARDRDNDGVACYGD